MIEQPKRARRGWMRAPVKWALFALAALFAADALYNPEKFRIKTIEVHGRFARVDAGQVERAVAGALSGNYFLADTAAIEARVAMLPWAHRAKVRRKWPDTLMVSVTEVQPVARWGRGQWLHVNGELAGRLPGADASLPRLSGPQGSRRAVWEAYQKWSGIFAANGLVIDSLRLDARGLWRLQLSLSALAQAAGEGATAPLEVVLRREHADAHIARFARAMPRSLLAHFAAMRSIDLRYPNGFAVGWRKGAELARAAGKTGNAAW